MASLQESCLVRFYRTRPNGSKTLLFQESVTGLAPAGGAPDGVASAVATNEKLLTVNSGEIFEINDVLQVSVELDASDGIDASDCIWRIPLMTSQGPKTLGRAQFTQPTFADITPATGIETFIAGYKIVESGARLSGKIFTDIQDDTA